MSPEPVRIGFDDDARPRSLNEARTWGLRFTDAESVDYVADALLEGYRGKPGQLPLVVTPNVDILVTLEDSAKIVNESVEHAAVVLADGQPLVSFSALAGDRLTAKLAGSDLTANMWPKMAFRGEPIFGVVSSELVGETLAHKYPESSYIEAPMLPPEEGSAIDAFAWKTIQQVLELPMRPRFLFIGIGFPKDVLVARSILAQWPKEAFQPPMILAVGASLEFIAGTKRRAPKFFQVLGIEFMHRILSEPKRMARRYLIKDSRFLLIVARQIGNKFGRRTQPSHDANQA